MQLTPKAFDLLVALVESRGKLLKKQELIERVWPGTFVEESNLAQNIATLRKALGDSPEVHSYIQTVPKQGYRFVTTVKTSHPAESTANQPEVSDLKDLEKAAVRGRMRTAILVLISCLAVIGAWYFLRHDALPVRARPITSLPGMEIHPALSPDGLRTAFAWIAADGRKPQIYVAGVNGEEPPVRLTASDFADAHPAWSTDGSLIAFIRNPGENGEVHVVPREGGASRKIANTRGRVLAWWPDSQSIVVSDQEAAGKPASLYQISLTSGTRRKFTSPKEGVGDVGISFSHDGRRLAVVRWSSDSEYEILTARMDGMALHSIVRNSTPVFGLAWSTNDEEVIYSATRDTGPRLWRIRADAAQGQHPEPVRNVEGYSLFPSIHKTKGSKLGMLIYSQMQQDVNIHRWELQDKQVASKTRIAPSTRLDVDPAFSPGGEKIAFASDRSGNSEIWLCRGDGSNPFQLTRFHAGTAGSPQWSADGTKIAFDYSRDGHSSVYVINSDGSGLFRLVTGRYQAVRPSWSKDSKSIYFQCAAHAGREICRIPSGGGAVAQVTAAGGAEAHESIDGRFLYYVKSVDEPGLWMLPLGGGPEELVLPDVWQGYWGIAAGAIYYVQMVGGDGPGTLRAMQMKTGLSRDIAAIPEPILKSTPGFAITPDGRSMLLVQIDRRDSDLMIVDNFR